MQEERILPPVKVKVLEKKSQGVMYLTILCIVSAIVAFLPAGWLTAKGILSEGLFLGLLCVGPWFAVGIFFLLIATGLRTKKRWAWILSIVFGILGFVYDLLIFLALSTIPAEFRPLAFTTMVALNLVLDIVVVVLAIVVRDRFKKEEYHLPWMPPSPMM